MAPSRVGSCSHLLNLSRCCRKHGALTLQVVRIRTRLIHRQCGSTQLPQTPLHGAGCGHVGLDIVNGPVGARPAPRRLEMGVPISRSISRSLVRSRHRNVSRARVSHSRIVQFSICNRARHSTAQSSLVSELRTSHPLQVGEYVASVEFMHHYLLSPDNLIR